MSDSKRTGSRDISDLKARLGLKKGGAPTTGQSATRSNGVVAPPGLNLPPPPGLQPQQPPQPVIPNAADDPFGAMNAMAAVGTVQRAPEIVVVNDGNVESVNRKSMGATIAKIAIPGVVALIIGLAIGKIGTNGSSFNTGLDDAKAILGEQGRVGTIAHLKQTLSSIDTLLEQRSRQDFRPDAALDVKLQNLTKDLEIKQDLFRGRQAALDADTLGQVIQFYAGVAEVKSMLESHLSSRRADNNIFTKNKEKDDAAKLKDNENAPLVGKLRYAALLVAPKEKEGGEFGVKIVELGGLYCDGETKKPAVAACAGGAPTHVAYRSEITQPVNIPGEIANPIPESVPANKVVELLPGTVRDQFIKGAEGVATETAYKARLKTVFEFICKREKGEKTKCKSDTLLELGNRVQTKVEAASKQDKRISFFM